MQSTTATISVAMRNIGAVWGFGGVMLLLLFAVFRLTPFVSELFRHALSCWQFVILIIWLGVMGYSEGYKAFGKQFSPRVVARAQFLSRHGSMRRIIFAPLFCVGYFGAPRKRVVSSVILSTAIIILIVLVHFVAQPWRGIIDSGVVFGLTIGIVYLVIFGYRALHQAGYVADPETI